MPELTELRALLHDRQVKEGALGSYEATICLDTDTVDLHKDLVAERDEMIKDHDALYPKGDKRLSGPVELPLDTSELDQRIEEALQRVKDTTVVCVFRALSSVRYQEILNDHPDAQENEGLESFLTDLCAACFREVRLIDGTKVDLSWDEIRENITYGELEPITIQVLAINRRRIDVPFSLKPSRKTR